MSKTIRIRNVPDALYRKLEERAAQHGRTLTEYLREELAQLASTPTLELSLAKLEALPRMRLDPTPTELLRQARGDPGAPSPESDESS